MSRIRYMTPFINICAALGLVRRRRAASRPVISAAVSGAVGAQRLWAEGVRPMWANRPGTARGGLVVSFLNVEPGQPRRRRCRPLPPMPGRDTADGCVFADLARELEAPLQRAHELLALLDRRAAERWSDDEA